MPRQSLVLSPQYGENMALFLSFSAAGFMAEAFIGYPSGTGKASAVSYDPACFTDLSEGIR